MSSSPHYRPRGLGMQEAEPLLYNTIHKLAICPGYRPCAKIDVECQVHCGVSYTLCTFLLHTPVRTPGV